MIANKCQREVLIEWRKDIHEWNPLRRPSGPFSEWESWMRLHHLPLKAQLSFEQSANFEEAYRMLDEARINAIQRYNKLHNWDTQLTRDSNHLCHVAASLMQQLERCAENETSPAE